MYTNEIYFKFRENFDTNPIQMAYVVYELPTSDDNISLKLTEACGTDFENKFLNSIINCNWKVN